MILMNRQWKYIWVLFGFFAFLISLSLPAKEKAKEDRMVLIPAGEFVMGADKEGYDERPPHKVYINSFYMDKYEVTQEEYQRVTGKPSSIYEQGQNMPVTGVSWNDAARYCNKKSETEGLQPCYNEKTWQCDFSKNGYRLPTEAEWEYACRAGSMGKYCCGDDKEKLKEYAWHNSNAPTWTSLRGETYLQNKAHPVGSKKPNTFGLYDMHGNVWEWCNDQFSSGYYSKSPGKNPRGPRKGKYRVLRGADWMSIPDDCRCAKRARGLQDYKFMPYGFRCVRTF
ncbi:formylglycine-generating enzyme family protein [bacterium]|nr:formylglycine-generating enzyme family protein [bacterium]